MRKIFGLEVCDLSHCALSRSLDVQVIEAMYLKGEEV